MTELLAEQRRVHLVGVGGAGMSGLARILLQRGHAVSGSDLQESRSLAELRALGARVAVGHDADNLGDAEVVVRSSAVSAGNPEVTAATERGLVTLRRADLLAALMAGQRAVLIAGTHGKTTTTSMTVVGLQAAGADPSFAIGGQLNESGTNAHGGTDEMFVAEADESDRSFLAYTPDVAVVTNVELDHPDEFRDDEAVTQAFADFLARRTDGAPAIVCADDVGAMKLTELVDAPVITYGSSPHADVRVVAQDGGFVVRTAEGGLTSLRLAMPGRHNVLNATAALAVVHHLELDPEAAATGLTTFTGAARRFQHIGEVDGVTIVDDYAHHPTELRVTLAAARELDPQRLIVVVQPHRYSRTQLLGAELGRAAAAAELIIVTDVYGSSEPPVPGVTGQIVADAARDAGGNVRYHPHLTDVVDALVELTLPGDLVLVTGAGDVTQVGPALLNRLGGGA